MTNSCYRAVSAAMVAVGTRIAPRPPHRSNVSGFPSPRLSRCLVPWQPKRISTGHIRQRSAGSFELRYSLRREPATGKWRIAATTFKGDRRAAVKELRRLLRTIDTGEHVDPNRMTLAQWLRERLRIIRAEISPKSQERYGEIVENFLIPKLATFRW